MFSLQNLVFSENPKTRYLYEKTGVVNEMFTKKDTKILDFCTYFNLFSVSKWINNTNIDNFHISLFGEGSAFYSIIGYDSEYKSHIIQEGSLIFEKNITIELVNFEKYVCLGLILKGEVKNLSGFWGTNTEPLRKVKMGAVITTFKREEKIKYSAEMFKNITIPMFSKDSLHLFIIDNGNSFKFSNTENITVIPNKNFGGAGGFTRGILEAEQKECTHVLLMDDDAICQPESIYRAYNFLSYCVSESLAIAGAMNLNDTPYLQYENGAFFDLQDKLENVFYSCGCMKNLGDIKTVINNEIGYEINPNYGAWWFFAFNLKHMKHYPFPFFVRGDDIEFSISNNFKILTLNGVAAWCDDFRDKLVPMVEYLATRSMITITLMHGNEASTKKVIKFYANLAIKYSLYFMYAEVNAIFKGIDDALSDLSFYAENMIPMEIFQSFEKADMSYEASEKEQYHYACHQKITFFKKIIYIVTLMGALLPSKGRAVYSDFFLKHSYVSLFRANKAAYLKQGKIYIYPRNVMQTLKNVFRAYKYKRIKNSEIIKKAEEARKKMYNYKSKDFWTRKLYE